MKDYIYLDSDLLNSTIAQFEEGLIKSISTDKHSEQTNFQEHEKLSSKGMDGIFNVGARLVHEVTESNGQDLTKGQSEAIDYVLNDYAVDLLLRKITENDLCKDTANIAIEGDFINCESNFKLYDFDLLKKITAPGTLGFLETEITKEDFGELEKARKKLQLIRSKGKLSKDEREKVRDLENTINNPAKNEILEGFSVLNSGVSFANQIFENSILVKTTESLSICKRECFRLNQIQLSFLAETDRKITVFGIVNAIKEKTHKNGDFANLNTNELNKVPSMFHDLFLSNFHILNDNDRIIKPIAIFFE